MDSRVEQAVEMFGQGYTCSQAVFVTYADLFGLDREQALRLSSPFGGGLGGMREVCGTVAGMSMLAGLRNGMVAPRDNAAKKANFDTVKTMSGDFKEMFGSIRCGQLLGLEPGLPEGMEKRPCAEYVRASAELVEEYLFAEND